MHDEYTILLLSLLYEGGQVQVMTSQLGTDVPVYRLTNECYDLGEEDSDIPLSSSTEYVDIETYWASFTESSYWYYARPDYVHSLLFPFVQQSLDDIDAFDAGDHKQRRLEKWREAIADVS